MRRAVMRPSTVFASLTLLAAPPSIMAQSADPPVRALVVTAHPDDDAAFAGTVYRITHHLGGVVDLALITDGSGGFRYATLAEPIYGLQLTDEAVARQYLPAIRKRELMAGGAIVGIRNYFFLDQYDDAYTLNADTVLAAVWDSAAVRTRLATLMRRGSYDLVIGLLPYAETHGQHKSATILALYAAQSLDRAEQPAVLGGFFCALDRAQEMEFTGLDGYPITRVASGRPLVRFDRTAPLGYNDRLDYRIVANWVIAEHKSQGTMQLLMNRGEVECFWYFDANGEAKRDRVIEIFDALSAR